MITEIIKRDGRIEKFDMEKIEIAIHKENRKSSI